MFMCLFFSQTIVGNRGQLWTCTLSPHMLSPHLDFPFQKESGAPPDLCLPRCVFSRPYPQYGWDFPEEFPEKIPEILPETLFEG